MTMKTYPTIRFTGLLGVGLALAFVNQSQAIIVTPTGNANTLASTILGSGITLVGSPTISGNAAQSGTFTGGTASGIGINNGIVLTTGSASSVGNLNTSDNTTTAYGTSYGAGPLNTLVGGSKFDANTLTLTFNSAGGNLFFNYVFGSEEYNEYANTQFNDVFGFFLDGVNIA